ncbi:ABC transporter ATP-binding protein [Lusitaniella coriacea LEGE 07157]|uniref:ABC transporter ATP-binding protein n=1 Tax=Lusitaniella coriacea LEGE 07157 TaxID=945747 RepID=A0A8J7DYS1_9CYAN|nr:ABC transporter ATP-binding protein [Lusitaniella coriacea]MBE9118011.1 ABC transporter ATP-binding protein [Lusitaniella coriacea LEGE 07157]
MNPSKASLHHLETRQLTLSYGSTPVILDLNLAIPPGKITVLVGANGCGKSTLLRGLARLLKPRSGAVYLDGTAIFKLPTKTVAQQLGILPQHPTAPEGLTVRELVVQGRYPYQNWWGARSREDEIAIENALDTCRMSELAERPLDSLSGGQRQRAWIAMALAQDTEILLLDEPTTFLDLAHQVEVLDLLSELHDSQERTIVMVLHDLNLACRYADCLVAIQRGQIYAQGAPERVMTEGMLRDVFGLESRIVPDPVAGTPMCIPLSRRVKAQTHSPT